MEPSAESDSWDRLILADDTKSSIHSGLRAITRRDEIEVVWHVSQIMPVQGRCILNFYGPSGTGKTRAARSCALSLRKKLFQIDYASVISKYMGDTAKHIKRAFRQAADIDAVLFFDEADSLLSRRIDMDNSCATSINQNRNVLTQELDRFPGVVIVTTNLFANFDPAMLRRIQRHIKFKLPNRAMRKRLFELHLPNMERVEADLDIVAEQSRGLSGGDILNVCVNSIYAGSADEDSAQWKITVAMLMAEIESAKEAKIENARGDNHNAQ